MEATKLVQSPTDYEAQRLRLEELVLRRLLGVQGSPGIMANPRFRAWVGRLPAERRQGNRGIGGYELHDRWMRWPGNLLHDGQEGSEALATHPRPTSSKYTRPSRTY